MNIFWIGAIVVSYLILNLIAMAIGSRSFTRDDFIAFRTSTWLLLGLPLILIEFFKAWRDPFPPII